MGCLFALAAVASPRLVLLLIWILNWHYIDRAFHTFVWPLLGFIFLPLTTLIYLISVNSFGGLRGWALLFFVLAIFADLGALSSGGLFGRRRLA